MLYVLVNMRLHIVTNMWLTRIHVVMCVGHVISSVNNIKLIHMANNSSNITTLVCLSEYLAYVLLFLLWKPVALV